MGWDRLGLTFCKKVPFLFFLQLVLCLIILEFQLTGSDMFSFLDKWIHIIELEC